MGINVSKNKNKKRSNNLRARREILEPNLNENLSITKASNVSEVLSVEEKRQLLSENIRVGSQALPRTLLLPQKKITKIIADHLIQNDIFIAINKDLNLFVTLEVHSDITQNEIFNFDLKFHQANTNLLVHELSLENLNFKPDNTFFNKTWIENLYLLNNGLILLKSYKGIYAISRSGQADTADVMHVDVGVDRKDISSMLVISELNKIIITNYTGQRYELEFAEGGSYLKNQIKYSSMIRNGRTLLKFETSKLWADVTNTNIRIFDSNHRQLFNYSLIASENIQEKCFRQIITNSNAFILTGEFFYFIEKSTSWKNLESNFYQRVVAWNLVRNTQTTIMERELTYSESLTFDAQPQLVLATAPEMDSILFVDSHHKIFIKINLKPDALQCSEITVAKYDYKSAFANAGIDPEKISYDYSFNASDDFYFTSLEDNQIKFTSAKKVLLCSNNYQVETSNIKLDVNYILFERKELRDDQAPCIKVTREDKVDALQVSNLTTQAFRLFSYQQADKKFSDVSVQCQKRSGLN